MSSLMYRALGVSVFDGGTFETIEASRAATRQAVLVVLASSFAGAIAATLLPRTRLGVHHARLKGLAANAKLDVGRLLAVDSRHVVPRGLDTGIVINIPQRMLSCSATGGWMRPIPWALAAAPGRRSPAPRTGDLYRHARDLAGALGLTPLIDWTLVDAAIDQRDGVVTDVSRPSRVAPLAPGVDVESRRSELREHSDEHWLSGTNCHHEARQ
jgi:hypothetical protein